MKTLKHLAIVALLCYGASAIAMDKQEFWILNTSSYEITVSPKNPFAVPEEIASGKASHFTSMLYEIQSKHANGVITILDGNNALCAKLDKIGNIESTNTIDISQKNVLVVNVGRTTGFTVTAMTPAEAKAKYPKAEINIVAAMSKEQVAEMIRSENADPAVVAQLRKDLEQRAKAIENMSFMKEMGVPFTLAPLNKNLIYLTEKQISNLTNDEMYRIYGFNTVPTPDALITYMNFGYKKRSQQILNMLGGNHPVGNQIVLQLKLLEFENRELLPQVEQALKERKRKDLE